MRVSFTLVLAVMRFPKLSAVVLVLFGFCVAESAWGGIVVDTQFQVSQELTSFDGLFGKAETNPVYVDEHQGSSMSSVPVERSQFPPPALLVTMPIHRDVDSRRLGWCESLSLVSILPMELLKIPIRS